MFSFFPLAKHFDYQNEDHWYSLSDNIQYTLFETEGKEKQLQSEFGDLMLDFFWMLFVAAYPSFPSREWATWDLHIPINGIFITSWLRDFGLQHLRDSQTPEVVHQFVFDELKQSIKHFFSILIISNL